LPTSLKTASQPPAWSGGRIQTASRQICLDPGIGRPGLVKGTREYPVRNTRLLLIYQDAGEAVILLNCWHTSRDRR